MNIYELKEKSHHGTKDFPIEVYHPIGSIATYHWHEEYEFIYIQSGSACIRIGAESYVFQKGECAYIKAGVLHSITTEDPHSFQFYAIVFHPSLLFQDMDICNKYFSSRYVVQNRFTSMEREQEVIETVKQICRTYEEKPFAYELKIKSCFYTLYAHIFENGLYNTEKQPENKKAVDKLEKVIKYIHANYHNPLTTSELAEVSGYSVSHFTHFFKELTGKTPIEYINRHRIYCACDLLKHSDHSVLEISLECGFEHEGYFIKTFRKHTGFTPYQYKRRYESS